MRYICKERITIASFLSLIFHSPITLQRIQNDLLIFRHRNRQVEPKNLIPTFRMRRFRMKHSRRPTRGGASHKKFYFGICIATNAIWPFPRFTRSKSASPGLCFSRTDFKSFGEYNSFLSASIITSP